MSPETGREELVLVGGWTDGGRGHGGLAPMEPYTLDLTSWRWRRWRAAGGAAGALPPRRQRAAAVRVTRRWLLVSGGSSEKARLT